MGRNLTRQNKTRIPTGFGLATENLRQDFQLLVLSFELGRINRPGNSLAIRAAVLRIQIHSLNLDPDPGFWLNLDPDPGLYYM